MTARTAYGPSRGVAGERAGAMGADTSYDTLTALNPAHLKALLGQEVVVTLGDASTRTGIVYTVDPVNFSVALLKPRRPLIKGTQVPSTKGHERDEHLCVVPGHAVKGVEVVGGQRAAMECLNSNGASAGWHSRRTINNASSPGTHTTPGDSSGGSRRMSLEFLRSYSNAPSPVQPGQLSRRARISDPGTYERVLDETHGGEMGSIAEGVERGERNAASPSGGPSPPGPSLGWEERRTRVRAALERARVPVHVDAATGAERVPGATALVVMGCAKIVYPFTADAVVCANEIVLARVRELVAGVQ